MIRSCIILLDNITGIIRHSFYFQFSIRNVVSLIERYLFLRSSYYQRQTNFHKQKTTRETPVILFHSFHLNHCLITCFTAFNPLISSSSLDLISLRSLSDDMVWYLSICSRHNPPPSLCLSFSFFTKLSRTKNNIRCLRVGQLK